MIATGSLKPGAVYQHYKGKIYQVVSVNINDELSTVQYVDEKGDYGYVIPLNDWFELIAKVTKESFTCVPKFTFIGHAPEEYPRYLTWFELLEYYSFQKTHNGLNVREEYGWLFIRDCPAYKRTFDEVCRRLPEMDDFITNHSITKFHNFFLRQLIGGLYYRIYDWYQWKSR